MLTLPPMLLKNLQLQAGSTVRIFIDHGKLVIEPIPRPHYTLDELLTQCDAQAEISAEDQAWINDNPTGNEVP